MIILDEMIKRVIFDIDNTLIPWKNEYYNEIFEVLKELNTECSNEEFNKIKQAFGEYENVYYSFNKENMINYINEYTGKKYPKEFMDKYNEAIVVIDKTGMGSVINFTDDERQKLEKNLKFLAWEYRFHAVFDNGK